VDAIKHIFWGIGLASGGSIRFSDYSVLTDLCCLVITHDAKYVRLIEFTYTKKKVNPLSCTSIIAGNPGDWMIGKVDRSISLEITPKVFCFLDSSALPLLLAEGSEDDFNYIQQHFDFTPNTGEFYSRLPNQTVLVRFTMGCFWDIFRWQCLIKHSVDHGEAMTWSRSDHHPGFARMTSEQSSDHRSKATITSEQISDHPGFARITSVHYDSKQTNSTKTDLKALSRKKDELPSRNLIAFIVVISLCFFINIFVIYFSYRFLLYCRKFCCCGIITAAASKKKSAL
jgi:hypothetical protein